MPYRQTQNNFKKLKMISLIKKVLGFKQPDFNEILKNGALVIDVRTVSEFAQGHAKGSTNIPLNELGSHLKTIKHSGKQVITCCKSGGRASMANGLLKGAGIKAYNAGAWQNIKKVIEHN